MTFAIRTIRRGTKKFTRILDNARNIKAYSLDNGFVGREMREDNPNAIMHPREWLKRELERFRFAKLQKKGNGAVYIVHVHGNLWYEFESGEE